RVQAQDRPTGIAADILGIRTGRTGDLGTLAGLQLDVVHDGTDRHALERHGVARLHVDGGQGRDDLVTGGETLRRHDVAQLTVFVLDQRDPGGAVRVVLEPLDGRDLVEPAALEVDHAVGALVTTTTMIGSDAATVVAATALGEAFGQGLDRGALPQLGAVGRNQRTTAFRSGVVSLESHFPVSIPLEAGRN